MDTLVPAMARTTRQRVTTSCVDEARSEVASLFCPHALEPIGPARGVDVRLRATRLGALGLVFLDYGAAVRIEPVPLADFFLVQVPLGGSARVRCGTEEIVSTPQLASVPHPDRPLWMEWGDGNPQLIFYVDRPTLEQQLARLLGRPGSHPVDFRLGMSMTDPRGLAWWRAVEMLRDEIVGGSPLLDEPVAMHQLEQVVLTRLLLAQPHASSHLLLRAERAPGSRVVERARTIMDERCGEELSVADVAGAVGISVRSLQEGFRRDLGTSPTSYLRDLRMARARSALLAADPARASVTTIAMRAGFAHLGRFSVDYRRRYGESPRETLVRG